MEFAPDTRILTDDEDDDNGPGGSDFDREFNRKSSDLSHIQRGPGAIQPKGGSRYSARANLPTHAESGPGSPPPPPPASSPPKESSSRFSPSFVKKISASRQPTARAISAGQDEPTPAKSNKFSYRGIVNGGRKASPPTQQQPQVVKAASSGDSRGIFRPSYVKRDSSERGMGGSGVTPTAAAIVTSASGDGTPADVQRKRMEARRKMQMQMEYDATPSKDTTPRYSSGGSKGGDASRQIRQTYSDYSHSTEKTERRGGRSRVDDASVNSDSAGSAVLSDLNKLSDFLKERKQQKALKDSNVLDGIGVSSSGPSVAKKPTVASYMRDRGY